MTVNKVGCELIKRFEGMRLRAYRDSVGVWTIGYGHTRGVQAGDVVTEDEANALLIEDLRDAEYAVERYATVALNDNQFAALASFVFNLGGPALKRSTLLRKLNGGDFDGAANEFKRWNKAGGKVLAGLVARRAEEEKLFRRPVEQASKFGTLSAVNLDRGTLHSRNVVSEMTRCTE